MDSNKSKNVSNCAAHSNQAPHVGAPGAANQLAIYGCCGKPVTDFSSTNSSVTNSTDSITGSDQCSASFSQRQSPISSSDSSELDQCIPLLSGLPNNSSRRCSQSSNDSHAKPNTAMATNTSTGYRSKNSTAKESKEFPINEEVLSSQHLGERSSREMQQHRVRSSNSEPLSWQQDSIERSPVVSNTKQGHPAAHKETTIAVQRSVGVDHGTKDKRKADRGPRPPSGQQTKRAPARNSGSDRLPLHQILNDPRVYYVIAFAGVAALMVISATGFTLAVRRRRRKRRRHSLASGLTIARDMATVLLTASVTCSRWFRRLLFK